jgi:hypothetical protein
MISQHATLENFEKFIGPLYTVLMAFSIYLFITYDPNAEDCEECEEEKEDCEEEKEDCEEEKEDCEEEKEECEEEQEECEEEQEECEEEQGQDEKDEDEEEIVKSQEIHEHYTVNIQKDILKRLSFLERLFRDLATSEHRLNSAILDAMVTLLVASTDAPASSHDKSVSYATLSLHQRLEWMEVCCSTDGWAHSNRAAQKQLKALQSLSKVADERERAWLAAVAYSPI